MNTAAKGRRAEHRVRRILEAAGYEVTRSAASRGVWDLIAWNARAVRFIQVKAGTAEASALEREAMQLAVVPIGATKELWIVRDREAPRSEVLR